MKTGIITRADIYDEALLKKSFKTYGQILKLLCIINIITFKLFEDRLLYQAEIARDLMMKAIDESFKK